MAYHHHHHPHPPTAAAPSCYCCHSSTQTHHLPTPTPPPPLSLPNPLLVDAVVSRLLHINSYQTPRKTQTHQSYQHYRPLGTTPDISSLIDRIEALEASLHRFSFSAGSIVSVRYAAACVIQRRFRAFLARRSRILRQLQDLDVVKSSYTELGSSVSNSSYVRFEHISPKVDGLLLQLDSIEEDDPMINEGKRSIVKNLDRFLRYVDRRSDEVLSSRRNNGRRTVSSDRKDNIRLRAQREMMNDLKGRVERIRKMSRVLEKEEQANDVELQGFDDLSDLEEKNGGVSVKGIQSLRNGGVRGISAGGDGMKKNVMFVGNGDAYRAIRNSDEQGSIEGDNDSGDDSVEASEKFKKIEVEDSSKDEEEGQEDNGGSYSDGSDGGMSGRRVQKEGGSGIRGEHHGPRYVFTPPLPEKMESVADCMMKKKKEVKL